MKRRNFLSGLLAAPLAFKARLARFFGRKPVELCNAPIGKPELDTQPDVEGLARLAAVLVGNSSMSPQALVDKWVASASTPFRSERTELHGTLFVSGLDQPITDPPSAHCSLPRGHKGPHVLLNPR